MFTGQVIETGVAAVTVKVRVQVTVAPQLLVAVKVNEELPPQAFGVPGLLFDKLVLQPPATVANASHAAYFMSIAVCVWQAASVTLVGQVKFTTGAAVTAKLLVQVIGAAQLLVAVNVTVAVPPQAFGTTVLLLVSTVLQPPAVFAVASQAANFASMAVCV